MSNDWLFALITAIDILFVIIITRLAPGRLLGAIVINLILVSIFGSMLINVFGLQSNAGNIFYACVFLAVYFIIDREGKQPALKTIWLSGIAMVFFLVLAQLTAHFAGLDATAGANTAIKSVFNLSIRVSVASLLAYVFAQYINITVFEWIKAKTHGKHLWLRANGANMVGQMADSLIFFSIAFVDLPSTLLLQTIVVGWLLKVAVVAIGTPFLYLNPKNHKS